MLKISDLTVVNETNVFDLKQNHSDVRTKTLKFNEVYPFKIVTAN